MRGRSYRQILDLAFGESSRLEDASVAGPLGFKLATNFALRAAKAAGRGVEVDSASLSSFSSFARTPAKATPDFGSKLKFCQTYLHMCSFLFKVHLIFAISV